MRQSQRIPASRVAAGLLLFLISVGCELSFGVAQEPDCAFRIVGYLPDYRFSQFDVNQAKQLTDVILFAAEPNAEGEIELGNVENAPWDKLQQLRREQHIRVLLCVGGWGRSDHFSRAVTSAQGRARFVASAETLLRESLLDGLDIDWEYPETEAEWNGYIQLLKDLKRTFQSQGRQLSITVAPSRKLPPAAWQAVDLVQIMSYDNGPRHATPKQFSADIQSFLDQGIPAEKLIIGLPFYGRDTRDRKALTYATLMSKYHPTPEVDEVENYYFNGSDTIRRKTQTALRQGLAGVMIWELGQDTRDDTSLLKAIAETVRSFDATDSRSKKTELK